MKTYLQQLLDNLGNSNILIDAGDDPVNHYLVSDATSELIKNIKNEEYIPELMNAISSGIEDYKLRKNTYQLLVNIAHNTQATSALDFCIKELSKEHEENIKIDILDLMLRRKVKLDSCATQLFSIARTKLTNPKVKRFWHTAMLLFSNLNTIHFEAAEKLVIEMYSKDEEHHHKSSYLLALGNLGLSCSIPFLKELCQKEKHIDIIDKALATILKIDSISSSDFINHEMHKSYDENYKRYERLHEFRSIIFAICEYGDHTYTPLIMNRLDLHVKDMERISDYELYGFREQRGFAVECMTMLTFLEKYKNDTRIKSFFNYLLSDKKSNLLEQELKFLEKL